MSLTFTNVQTVSRPDAIEMPVTRLLAASKVPVAPSPAIRHEAVESRQPAGTVSVTVSVALPTSALIGPVCPEPTIV